jgi:hypothetical protein
MLHYYRVDLTEVCSGRGYTPTLVLALIENLPADSAFTASTAAGKNGVFDEWRTWQSGLQSNLLAASQIDFTREGTQAQVGKKYKFKPYPRPGAKSKPKVLTVAEINAQRAAQPK